MYEIFTNAIAQMGAVGILLAFAGVVIYWLREDNKAKDHSIKEEMEKREQLLREVLSSHQAILDPIRSTSESLIQAVNRVEDIVERIEDKVNEKGYSRKG